MKTNRLTIAWLASTLLLGASCLSCSDESVSIEKEVGRDGAVLRLGNGTTLTIPPGSLPQGAKITMSEVGDHHDSSAEVGKVLRLEHAVVLESENEAGDPTVAGQPS